jgi:hypothetical protein
MNYPFIVVSGLLLLAIVTLFHQRNRAGSEVISEERGIQYNINDARLDFDDDTERSPASAQEVRNTKETSDSSGTFLEKTTEQSEVLKDFNLPQKASDGDPDAPAREATL